MACSQSLQPAPSHCTVELNRRQWSKLKCHKQCLKSRQMVICNLLFIICNVIFLHYQKCNDIASLAIVTKKLCILFQIRMAWFPTVHWQSVRGKSGWVKTAGGLFWSIMVILLQIHYHSSNPAVAHWWSPCLTPLQELYMYRISDVKLWRIKIKHLRSHGRHVI